MEVARRPRRAIENLAAIVVVGYVFRWRDGDGF